MKLRSKFSKAAKYRMNTKIPIALLNASGEQLETKIKNTVSFLICPQTYHISIGNWMATVLHFILVSWVTPQTLGGGVYYLSRFTDEETKAQRGGEAGLTTE